MSSTYPGMIRAAQIKDPSSVAVTTDATVQSVRGGKTFYQLGALDAVPSFGYAQATQTPGRFVGDSDDPTGSTYKYVDAVVADRLINASRGYWMSAVAFAGYARYAALGFHQYAGENAINDVGYLDLVACPQTGGAPAEVADFGVPDDVASPWRWRAGLSAGYWRYVSLGTAVTDSPQKPATNAANVYAVTKAALATFGLAQPAGNYLPLIKQYDNGAGGSSYALMIDSAVGDLRYWRQTDGAVVTTGGQTFSGLKSFAAGVLVDSLDLYTADGTAEGTVRAGHLRATSSIAQDDSFPGIADDFYLELGRETQAIPDSPAKAKVRLYCKTGELTGGEPRNSYYEELQDPGDPLAVPFIRFAKPVDGTDIHAVASDRAVGRVASRAFSAGPGHTYGLAGEDALAIGVSDVYGAVYEVDFAAAAAVLIADLSILCASVPASGTVKVRLTTKAPGSMTFPASRQDGFIAELTIDLAANPKPADHVPVVGAQDVDNKGVWPGPIVVVRTPADDCKLYVQVAYSGGSVAGFGANPKLGGQYVQTGIEAFAHLTRQAGPMTPSD